MLNNFLNLEFTFIFRVAQKFGLKSHSYGNGSNRQIVVSIKKKPWEIVQELLNGKQSVKYELIYPSS